MLHKTLLALACLLAVQALAQEPTSDPLPEPAETAPLVSRADGLAAWDKIHEIVSHPRCVNCHVPEDNRPRWSGPSYGLADGDWMYHGMNVHGGDDRIGATTLPCGTCHQQENSDQPHGPPGAAVWALAPVEMTWWQKTSEEICAQIKDPARNGGRSLDAVADHVDHDELVHWGWDPGPGREPAPYSRKDMVAFLEAWAAAGAPCAGETDETDL